MASLKKSLLKKGYHKVNLIMTKDCHMLVSVSVNNEEALFLVDSGASMSCIDAHVSDFFNLTMEEVNEPVYGAVSSVKNVQISRDNELNIKGWRTKKCDFVVMDMQHINEALEENSKITIQGILGGDLLKKSKAIIDYKKKRLYLYKGIFYI